MNSSHYFIEGLWGSGKTTTRDFFEKKGFLSIAEPNHVNQEGFIPNDTNNFKWYTIAFAQQLEIAKSLKVPVLFERSYASTLAFYEAMKGDSIELEAGLQLAVWKNYKRLLAKCILLTFPLDGYIKRIESLPDQAMAEFLFQNLDFLHQYPDSLKKYSIRLFGENLVQEIPVGTTNGFLQRAQIDAQLLRLISSERQSYDKN